MRRQVHGVMIMRYSPRTTWPVFVGLLAGVCLQVSCKEAGSPIALASQQSSFFYLEQSTSSFLKP
jgi:hypothetical protein